MVPEGIGTGTFPAPSLNRDSPEPLFRFIRPRRETMVPLRCCQALLQDRPKARRDRHDALKIKIPGSACRGGRTGEELPAFAQALPSDHRIARATAWQIFRNEKSGKIWRRHPDSNRG
jgi:hypothetical protein